ncbi:MAG: helix-turn-helix domain-containing protein [Candidatus Cloacimonadales bacterium]|nr:helix-turn-helix domain-containing protein [Methanolobus sp.]
MSIGLRFKEIRTELKLNQTAFSAKLRLTQSAVSQIEKNIITPSSDVLINISQTYKININWLLTGTGEMFLSAGKEPEDKQEDNSELLSLKKRYDQLERVYNDLKKSIDQSEKEYSLLSTKNQELNQELFTRLKELLECKDLIIKLQKN